MTEDETTLEAWATSARYEVQAAEARAAESAAVAARSEVRAAELWAVVRAAEWRAAKAGIKSLTAAKGDNP